MNNSLPNKLVSNMYSGTLIRKRLENTNFRLLLDRHCFVHTFQLLNLQSTEKFGTIAQRTFEELLDFEDYMSSYNRLCCLDCTAHYYYKEIKMDLTLTVEDNMKNLIDKDYRPILIYKYTTEDYSEPGRSRVRCILYWKHHHHNLHKSLSKKHHLKEYKNHCRICKSHAVCLNYFECMVVFALYSSLSLHTPK